MTTKQDKKGVSRRSVLKGAAATAGAALGSGAITGFPTIWAQNIKDVTLRQFGTGVSNLNDVAQKVKEDLGFTLEMTALDSDSVTQRGARHMADLAGSQRPGLFDRERHAEFHKLA